MFFRLGILFFLFMLFNASTCEREVDLNLAVPEDKLVIFSTFEAEQPIVLQLGKSKKVLNQDPEEFLPGATINLFENGVFKEQLDFVTPTNPFIPPYYTSAPTTIGKVGITYKVEAELESFEKVEAESRISTPSTIQDFAFFDLIIDDESSPGLVGYSYNAVAKIDDPLNAVNYYHLIVYQVIYRKVLENGVEKLVPYLQILNFDESSSTNDVVAHLNGGILVKNNPFQIDGYQFKFDDTINPNIETMGVILFEFRTVSDEYYLFYSSIAKQNGITNTLFSEPVFIYENVKNGYGIFAGYSAQVLAIELQE